MISYDQVRHFCFYVLSKSSPYRINVCELMARSYVKSCKHFHVSRCAQMCFNKKYNQIEIILYSYIMQYRSFDLSNIRRIMGISTNDYTNLIATVQGASSYIASRTITISVGMLESIHMFRKLNKWTLNEYFYRPVKIVFIQCDVKLICLLICVRQHCNPEAE